MSDRRDFLKTTAVVGGVAAVGNLAVGAFAGGGDTIKVGLVGCGGRGLGAVKDILNAEEKINGRRRSSRSSRSRTCSRRRPRTR